MLLIKEYFHSYVLVNKLVSSYMEFNVRELDDDMVVLEVLKNMIYYVHICVVEEEGKYKVFVGHNSFIKRLFFSIYGGDAIYKDTEEEVLEVLKSVL